MTVRATLTLNLPAATSQQLERLADRTNRPVASLAADVLVAFAREELATIEAIERGLAQVRAGQTVSQEEVFEEVWAIIESSRTQA